MSHKVNNSLPMTRISTRKSVEIQPNNKLSDTDTKIRVITGRHDRRKQTLKTILRDEAPVFLAHEEVVVSNNLKKGRKSSKNRLKGEDLSRPPLRGGLTETKTRCIQVTEEVGKALRTGAWQNRKEDIGSLSCRNKQPTNCDSDIMSVDSAVSRKRVNTNIPPHKESTPTMLSKVRENRKASRCCAECKSVVFDRDKLRLRGALGVKICDSCWSKKKPKEVHLATQPVLPRATSPTVKKCLVKLFDVSRYPAGHPFGKGFLSQRSLKRKFNESQVVLNDTANEMIVQPKRARRGGSSTFPVEFVNTSKEQQCKDGKQIFEINSRQLNETGAKERTRAASNSRNVSSVTTDVTISNKNEKSYRRTSDQSTAENTEQEKLGKKLSVSPLKVNAQRLPERRVSRKNSLSTETITKTRTSRRSSSNNESASEKKTLRKNGLNTEVPSEKRTIQKEKGSENVESSTEKSERSSMNTEISSERKSRRSSMNAEITSQKKTPQRTKMMVETASEKMVSRSSSVNAEIEGGKKTSRRSSTSTETTPARVSRRNSINTETASEIRILRRNSNETSGTRTKRGSSTSNNLSKSALPVRIQSKNENLPGLLRKGQKQVISSGKAKIALSNLETKGDRNTSKIRLSQIRSVALRKMLPEAAVAKSSLTNNKKTQLILEKNKPNTVISRKGSVLPKYGKPGERPHAKSVLTRKTGNDFKNRKSLSHGGSKSVFGKLHSKITTVQHIKKSDVNTLDTSPLSEKTAASRKRKMDLPDKSPGVKKRKIERVPVRRKQTAVEKEFTRAKNLTYKCDMCNNKYSSLAEERLHELSHTGRQPVLVLHKCDSPQGVLSLIREDDFSSLNICSSDSEIQKGVTYEMNMTYDGSNTEMNAGADIGTVQTVERKDEDTDAIQVENLENTDEERKSNVNKSLEMVETGEMHDTDHEKSIPFDNCDAVPVLKKQDIEHSQQRIRSDADICPPAEMDKNKTDPILENSKASKAEIELSKESSSVCSPEIAKKPKSSDEIAVLLEEIFGESSEEDLISVTGIRNLRQTADAVNSGIDKTSKSSMEKPPYGMNTLQHTSVTQNLATVVPSETAEAVTQYLKGETHNPEEILHQLNYGDKIVVENEAKTDTKTSSDTDQADTNIKLPGDVELNNSHKDWDSETSSVNNIEDEVTKLKDFEDDEGNRKQLVDNESEVLDGSQQVQSHDETVCLTSAKESILELSTDITDNKNQNLEDSTHEIAVGGNNVLEDKTSDDMRMTDDISLGGNKDFPNSITKDDSVISVKGSIASESSCKQSQIETVNQNVGHHDAYCIDSAGASPQHKYKVDSGDKHSISVLVESVNEGEQKATDQEKQVMLGTTNSTVTHEIVETCGNNDKCDERELPSEICRDDETVLECNDKDTVLECHKKEQFKSDKIFHSEDITENIVNEEQVDKKPIEIMEGETGSEINGKIIIEQVECVDNSDLLNKQNSDEVSEIAKIESNASEKCNTNTSVETSSQPENETHALGEVAPPTDLVLAANNENEVNSTKDSLADVLQNEICEDEAGATENGLIKDVLLVENKEANEMLITASDDIVGVTETGSRSIEVHSPSEADTVECMEIDSGKNSNDTVPKLDELNGHKYICDSSEVKDTELDLLTQPDGVCDASQETDSSYKGNINTTCDVSSKLDNKIVVSDSGHDIEYEEISATLDSGPELKIDNVEQEVESPDSGHNLDALNASHEAENVLQTETLDTEHEQQVLNPNNELSIEFASQKIQTFNDDGLEMKATNDTNSKDVGVDDCSPCTDHDGTNNSDESHQHTVQESAKEGTPVDVDQRAQSVDSNNLVDTKESEMEPLISNCGVDTTGKSEVVEAGTTAQEIEITDSCCGTQKVVSTCEDKTDDDVNCKIETEDVNSEAEVEKARQGLETANADHEVELVSASEVASNEVVVALDASSEGDALVSGDEVGTDIPFVPTSDLSTNSEITAGISDCCPSLVGVENLSFNVRHTVPDVFEEDEQILQEVGDHSILQEPDCADRNVETLTKGQNEIQEAEIADNVKPPLAVGLNGMNEKVIDECRAKMRADSDEMLKDNLNLPDSGDNDIAGLEPISDDELDFM
ncbi:uncharacterized protein LOC126475433 isoform X1 [Schistocerca serialis cubense]|uniref:uncharacterized protein LOC126475433 isoform X1 n=2 Tax=Schistocerca serialis cubense TaxID=2023355 RepID=UPI00214F5E9A|nr:uncharacterized protein LOC126475433 isoform X1 [Schistocerca serialis cubense]